jgi:hypothetical protein
MCQARGLPNAGVNPAAPLAIITVFSANQLNAFNYFRF